MTDEETAEELSPKRWSWFNFFGLVLSSYRDVVDNTLTRVAQHDLWRNQQRDFVDDVRLDLERLDRAHVAE